tara:strand:+ start:18976 stop:19245 length:270 start_codon:yes stop_codon:yes gene_type:complete
MPAGKKRAAPRRIAPNASFRRMISSTDSDREILFFATGGGEKFSFNKLGSIKIRAHEKVRNGAFSPQTSLIKAPITGPATNPDVSTAVN